jgi:hypothetical protein
MSSDYTLSVKKILLKCHLTTRSELKQYCKNVMTTRSELKNIAEMSSDYTL